MPSVPARSPFLRQHYVISMGDYHAFGDAGFLSEDVELLRGSIVQQTSKSPLHDIVLRLLVRRLTRGVSEAYDVRVESLLTLHDSEPEPDIWVVKWDPETRRTSHPRTALLVAEVAVAFIAVNEEKAHIYAEAGIPEYWLIRPEAREPDLYRKPTSSGYTSRTTLRNDDTLRAMALPGIELVVSDVFPPLNLRESPLVLTQMDR